MCRHRPRGRVSPRREFLSLPSEHCQGQPAMPPLHIAPSIQAEDFDVLIAEELFVRAFLPFAGRFVVVQSRISNSLNSSIGRQFRAVLGNLTTASLPHPSESVSPMLPNPDTTAQACKAKDKCESASHNSRPKNRGE